MDDAAQDEAGTSRSYGAGEEAPDENAEHSTPALRPRRPIAPHCSVRQC